MASQKESVQNKRRKQDIPELDQMDSDKNDSVANGNDPDEQFVASKKTPPKILPESDLDKMVADSLRDIPSDEDDDDSVDDPSLLAELQAISGGGGDEANTATLVNNGAPKTLLPTTMNDTLTIIEKRIEIYEIANAIAKARGEAANERRYERGLKTLTDLLEEVKAGKVINEEDIPHEVSVKKFKSKTDETESSVSLTPEKADENSSNPLVELLLSHQSEYKAAALNSKHSGDIATALKLTEVFVKFDEVIEKCNEGKEIDLSDMPPKPEQFIAKLKVGDSDDNETVDTALMTMLESFEDN